MKKSTQTEAVDEDLVLRLWDGDDSVRGKLLDHCGKTLLKAIRMEYPKLSVEDAEDVICEAIHRFWLWREKYDPAKSSIRSRLYWFAQRVAAEHRSGRLKRHRANLKEVGKDPDFFEELEARRDDPEPPDDVPGKTPSPVQRALRECFGALSPLQQDILQACADAGQYPLDAKTLGVDLGHKHKGGVPYPAGTIRTNKSRAWDTIETCMKRKNYDLKALGYSNE